MLHYAYTWQDYWKHICAVLKSHEQTFMCYSKAFYLVSLASAASVKTTTIYPFGSNYAPMLGIKMHDRAI